MTKKKLKKRVKALKGLVKHCWIHSGYPDCGYAQMTSKQKKLYDKIADRNEPPPPDPKPVGVSA